MLLTVHFFMPIEDVFSISGRGTVVTGRVERGIVKVGEEVESLVSEDTATTCTGVEMFRKLLDEGRAGENVGVFYVVLSVKTLSVVKYWLSLVQSRHTRSLKPKYMFVKR